MQRTVALSSMEAEYIGGCEITRNIHWLNQALTELGFRSDQATIDLHSLALNNSNPIPIKIDNKSAITFASEPMVQQRSRHVDIKYHYLRDKLDDKTVVLDFIPTGDMTADIFTKPLPTPLFRKFRSALGVTSIEGFGGCVEL